MSKLLPENLDCQKCLNTTEDTKSICCDNCNSWFHVNCSRLTQRDFEFFTANPNDIWFCYICLKDILPFQTLSDNAFKALITFVTRKSYLVQKQIISKESNYNKICSVCNKSIYGASLKKAIPCQTCMCLIHRRCSRLKPWEAANLSQIIQQWSCAKCQQSTFPFADINDEDMLALTFNSNFSCPCQVRHTESNDYNLLGKLELCKLNLKEHDYLFDNDIDNHAKFHTNFDFYSTHAFHKLKTNINSQYSETFSLFHSNIQSLLHNKENLELLLSDLDFNFDVIALSETWHFDKNKDDFKKISLQGYHDYVGIKGNSKCGGCGFLVSSSLRFNERKDLSKAFRDNVCEFDAFWIEIENSKNPNVLIVAVYNHPKIDSTKFIEYLESVFNKISKENKLIVIAGDFNLDLLRYDKIPVAEKFIDTMFSNFLQPLILQPTRFTNSNKPSLIDNIFINSIDIVATSGNLIPKITDHMPNFLLLERKLCKQTKRHIMKRDFTNFDKLKYLNDIPGESEKTPGV